MQTLSTLDVSFGRIPTQPEVLTNIVGLVKNYNGVFGHLFGDLFRDLRIQQVMEGIYDHIDERHLTRLPSGIPRRHRKTSLTILRTRK